MSEPKPVAVEKILDQINYSSSLINQVIDNTADVNIHQGGDEKGLVKRIKVIPQIVISESHDEPVPLVIPRRTGSAVSDSNNENVSRQTEIPSNNIENDEAEQMPQISKLLGRFLVSYFVFFKACIYGTLLGEKSNNIACTPTETDLGDSTSQSIESSDHFSTSDMIKFSTNSNNNIESSVSDCKLPNLTILHVKDDSKDGETVSVEETPAFSELMCTNENVPNLSALLANGCDNNTSQVQSNVYLPIISALNADSQNFKSNNSSLDST